MAEYFTILRRQWLIVVLATALGLGCAVAFIETSPVVYTSTARVFVSTRTGTSAVDLQQGNAFTQQRVKSYADLATTPAVLEPVTRSLGLAESPAALAQRISAIAPIDTTLISISASAPLPADAAALATSVAYSLGTTVEQLESISRSEESPVKLSVVAEAPVPVAPSSPDSAKALLVGGLVGALLGVLIAIARNRFDGRFRSAEETSTAVGAVLVGVVPFDADLRRSPLAPDGSSTGRTVEAFRVLRTNLQFLDIEGRTNGFVITSSVAAEGKTVTAVNLASIIAQTGARVLLVDADLRRPFVSTYLGIEGAAGLTDVLLGSAAIEDVVQIWGRPNLDVLASGTVPPNPAELLGSDRMARLIDTVSARYDVVIYDAPPVLPVADAAILGKAVGDILFVVADKRSRRHQARSAAASLAVAGARVSGVIVSMAKSSGPDGYAYGYGTYSSDVTESRSTGVAAEVETR